ncbi:hypothetical protein I6E36_13000 [Fusobacterium mortiferum]|uniref:hypothetical protein n=1 Tax=Fusobacterium mortiferum TaxID=850 RepID=UPI001F2951AE|nr:hypothetical protein [Fusobacterium mortiferum]MCF2628997.1 hypothetical protein [Fusobacterium mortiferum]
MKKIYIILGIISLVIIFSFLPIGIDKIFMNRFVTNWDMGQWAGFLGSYLGGGIGGIITLVGVWWQMTNEKKTKEKENKLGFLRHIEHILTRNLNLDKDKEIYQKINDEFMKNTYHVFSYNSFSLTGEDSTKLILEFNSNIINENLNYIYTLSFGKKLYELNDKIKEFNNLYDFLLRNLSSKKQLLEDLKDTNMNSYVDILERISNLVYNLAFNRGVNVIINIENFEGVYIPPQLKDNINEIITTKNNYKNNEFIKLVTETILIATKYIQTKLDFDSELAKKLINYRIKEDKLYQLDIFKIFEDMEEILSDIENEINRIEN